MALLDASCAGVRYEGEVPPEPTVAQAIARRVWSALATGQGGMDWAGLPIVAAWLGVADMDTLLHHLSVINAWRPPKAGEPELEG